MPAVHLLAALAFLATTGDTPSLQAGQAASVDVDGRLDEPEWTQSDVATDFIQLQPAEGQPSRQRTEVRILRGPSSLFVGATLYDSDPSSIRTTLSRRDDTGDGDLFVIAVDSYNDRRTAFQFGVTAAGVQIDAIRTGQSEDESWDAVWTSATRVTETGWVAEMEIPYSQLRFTGAETSWGLNLIRVIPRLDEQSFWAPLRSDQERSGFIEVFGSLTGVSGIRPQRVLQARPYTLARARRFESSTPDVAETGYGTQLGADVKLGLASGIVLDATINPDFGQVDADPAELNLSTFETFFEERRPFFLEGTQIFDFNYSAGDGSLLYTRRIGGESPIIGATKLTGRTNGGLSFGALGALTGTDFNPTRMYAAARAKQELPRQSRIGMGLAGYRSWNAEGDVSSVSGGADWKYRVGADADWTFDGTLASTLRSETDGTETVDHFGFASYLGFDRIKGFFTPGFGFRVYSDEFQLNDIGRFRQTDLISLRAGTSMRWNQGQPVGPFRRLQTSGFSTQEWRYTDGTNRGLDLSLSTSGQLLGYQDVSLRAGLSDVGGYDVRETRGLGPIAHQREVSLSVGFGTDARRQVRAEVDLSIAQRADGGRSYQPELEVDWTVNDRLTLSVDGELQFGMKERAWVTNEGFIRTDDGLFVGPEADQPGNLSTDTLVRVPVSETDADALFSDLDLYDDAGYYRPIFGSRDTRSASLTTRANLLFSSTLSLQLYGQLFSARGQYEAFELLASPDELRSFDDYPRRRDFALSAFNVNSVLRWEYRPGSSLYVVWTQARNSDAFLDFLDTGSSSFDSPYETTTGQQFQDTFGVFPNNVFLVKLSYLLM